MKKFFCLLILGILSCNPSQSDPVRYGVVKVWADPNWIPYDQERIRSVLTNLQALGPAFVLTANPSEADVLVSPYEANNCTTDGAGRYFPGTRRVEVDPVCTPGDIFFRATVGHEIGHALGMKHICRRTEEVSDCSPVGYGEAMMNPYYHEVDLSGDFVNPSENPTELDLAEFRRVRPPVL